MAQSYSKGLSHIGSVPSPSLFNKARLFFAQLAQKAVNVYVSAPFAWIIIAIGALLRFIQYQFNAALWTDEAALALNILNRSFGELLQPLDYNQGAPLGFLMLEKLAVTLFGRGELALRLVPFIAGLLSLVVFYKLAQGVLSQKAVPIALGFFVLSNGLIYYPSAVKQYSSDVLVALFLVLMTVRLLDSGLENRRRLLIFGVIGTIAIWFAHPAVFVLAGMGITLFLAFPKTRTTITALALPAVLWGVSFIVFYFVSLRNLQSNDYLTTFWQDDYFPLIPTSRSEFSWIMDTFLELLRYTLPFGAAYSAAAIGLLIGSVAIASRRSILLLALTAPILATMIASGFKLYPFNDRLILFLTPFLLLLIAEGIEEIIAKAGRDMLIVRVGVLGFLFVFAAGQVDVPKSIEEIRPILSYVQEHQQPDDIIYIHQGARFAYLYYAPDYEFPQAEVVEGIFASGDEAAYTADIEPLRGEPRVWFIFSHEHKNEDEFFVSYLNSIGIQKDALAPVLPNGQLEAQAYLYDLSEG